MPPVLVVIPRGRITHSDDCHLLRPHIIEAGNPGSPVTVPSSPKAYFLHVRFFADTDQPGEFTWYPVRAVRDRVAVIRYSPGNEPLSNRGSTGTGVQDTTMEITGTIGLDRVNQKYADEFRTGSRASRPGHVAVAGSPARYCRPVPVAAPL